MAKVKTLVDYPITLKFGATSWPYSKLKPHHGIDIGAPRYTPIKVGKLVLGGVGRSGFAFGYHTHIDRHTGNNMYSGVYVDPSNWPNIRGKVVYAGYLGTAGRTVIIKTLQGNYYRFLHMKVINCKVGDRTY